MPEPFLTRRRLPPGTTPRGSWSGLGAGSPPSPTKIGANFWETEARFRPSRLLDKITPRGATSSLCSQPVSPPDFAAGAPPSLSRGGRQRRPRPVGLAARRPGSLRRGLRKRGPAPVLGLRRTPRFQTSAPCALRPKAAVCFWGIPGAPRSPAQVTALPGLPLLPEAERHEACRSTPRPVSGGSEHKQGGQSRNS